MSPKPAPPWLWILVPALTMSLGWGLRGYIGGGPLGAMIPGAMVALAIALLLGRNGLGAGVIAAIGAIGVGFGGQETYGQTVGLAMQPETMFWALLGFAIKGGAWGLLGGAFLGLGLAREGSKPPLRDVAITVALMVAGTWVGWKLINQPKLIYFSNRVDKPREELWAGLLLGGFVLLGWLAWRGIGRLPLRLALWGAIGGGIGFALGAWFQVIGRAHYPGSWIDWWKMMEFTFGALFGAGLGYAAYLSRGEAPPERQEVPEPWPDWILLAASASVILALVLVEAQLPLRMGYTVVGAFAVLAAWRWSRIAWQIAITLTCCAFLLDLIKAKPLLDEGSWLAAAIVALIIGAWLLKNERALPAFLMLTWAAIGVSLLKTYLPPAHTSAGPTAMETMFVVMGVLVTIWAVGKPARAH